MTNKQTNSQGDPGHDIDTSRHVDVSFTRFYEKIYR